MVGSGLPAAGHEGRLAIARTVARCPPFSFEVRQRVKGFGFVPGLFSCVSITAALAGYCRIRREDIAAARSCGRPTWDQPVIAGTTSRRRSENASLPSLQRRCRLTYMGGPHLAGLIAKRAEMQWAPFAVECL